METTPTPLSPAALTKAMWRNWAVSYGSLIVPVVLSLFTPLSVLPIVALLEVYLLASMRRTDILSPLTACSPMTGIAIRSLLLSALVMIIINILCTDWLIDTVVHIELYNSAIPFVVCLVITPVTVLFCALSLWANMGGDSNRHSQRRNGFFAGDSMAATLYYREARYQTTIMLLLSTLMGAVEYWYYFVRYININFNDPDRFFFIYMPVAVYLLSLVFMHSRYVSMTMLCEALVKASGGEDGGARVRFLVFRGDEMLLSRNDGEDGKWDTPYEETVAGTLSLGNHQARTIFEELAHVGEFEIRYCFTNRVFASATDIVHYAVFIDPGRELTPAGKYSWFNAYMLDAALSTNALSPLLANELYRIHTITMAWKTYDRNGRRLYPIKHYRPTFRLRDLKDWTVDYDDETWFDVAHRNEDAPFFRLRNLWDRLTSVFRPKDSRQ